MAIGGGRPEFAGETACRDCLSAMLTCVVFVDADWSLEHEGAVFSSSFCVPSI